MSIKNPYLHGPDDKGSQNLKRWAAVSSLSVAGILIVTKLFAFLVTDSVALLSSLMDSSFDAVASLVTMMAIIHAATPADAEHRFGHGKVEALSALGQAALIFGSALFLIFESAGRLIRPVKIHDASIGVAVMIFSIVLTGALIVFQMYVIKKTKSVAVTADFLHYRGDLLMNLSVFGALVASYYSKWPYFDPIFAGIIGLSLIWGAYKVTHESFDILMDKEIPDADREKILQLARSHPNVTSVHDLRTRNTGERIFIEFHIEVDGEQTLKSAHKITEEIEKKIYDAFPKSEVLIHEEPAGLHHHKLDNIIPIKGS